MSYIYSVVVVVVVVASSSTVQRWSFQRRQSASSQDPRPFSIHFHVPSPPLPLLSRVFRVPPSSGSRNEILRYRAVGMETSIEEKNGRGKKERKRGREKAAAFRLMLSLSPFLSLSFSVSTDGSKASRDSAAYWWPDIPYASTRSKEDVSRGS